MNQPATPPARLFAHVPGVFYPSVRNHVTKSGQTLRRSRVPLTKEEADRIAILASESVSAFAISQLTGHAFYTVKRHLRLIAEAKAGGASAK